MAPKHHLNMKKLFYLYEIIIGMFFATIKRNIVNESRYKNYNRRLQSRDFVILAARLSFQSRYINQ